MDFYSFQMYILPTLLKQKNRNKPFLKIRVLMLRTFLLRQSSGGCQHSKVMCGSRTYSVCQNWLFINETADAERVTDNIAGYNSFQFAVLVSIVAIIPTNF